MILHNKSILKIVCIGDSNVGKTTIISRLQNKKFTKTYKATIGIDFAQKDIDYEGLNFQLQIWDTAGQENYRSIGASYYRNTDCCLLVFDKTSHKSLNDIDEWRRSFIESSNLKEDGLFPFILIGNKNDLKERIEVSEEEILKVCALNNYTYYDISAKEDDDKFSMLIFDIVRLALKREGVVGRSLVNDLRLKKIDSNKENQRCCN